MDVTEEYFPLMRVQPLAGRLLTNGDHDAASADVMVISDALRTRRFGADPAAIGKPLRLAGRVATIVGVAPAARLWPGKQDVWLPLRPAVLDQDTSTRRDNMVYLSIARVRPDVPFAQAQARIASLALKTRSDAGDDRGVTRTCCARSSAWSVTSAMRDLRRAKHRSSTCRIARTPGD